MIQKIDLIYFFLLQYALPVISFFDIVTSIVINRIPIYWPLSFVAFGISGVAFLRGCTRTAYGPKIPSANLFNLFAAIIYLSHWFIIIPLITMRMAIRSKNLVWLKTNHTGK